MNLEHALQILRAGGVVIVPTETVYGLAADARNPAAVQRVLDLKGARGDKPLPVQVPSLQAAASWVRIPPLARQWMEAHWPGPLTLVLPEIGVLPAPVSAGTGTLGIRCPDHPLTLALLRAFGGPLVVPSANRSGEPPPKTFQAAQRAFDAPLLVLDGGDATGSPSTVVRLVDEPEWLRSGPLDSMLGFDPA